VISATHVFSNHKMVRTRGHGSRLGGERQRRRGLIGPGSPPFHFQKVEAAGGACNLRTDAPAPDADEDAGTLEAARGGAGADKVVREGRRSGPKNESGSGAGDFADIASRAADGMEEHHHHEASRTGVKGMCRAHDGRRVGFGYWGRDVARVA